MTIYEAINSDKCSIDIKEAVGRIPADFVYAFPPDVPVLIPGEEITKEKIDYILALERQGVRFRGLHKGRIDVTV